MSGGRVTFKKWRKVARAQSICQCGSNLIPYLKSRGVGKLDALVLDPYRHGPYGRYGGGCQTNPGKKVYVSPGSSNQFSISREIETAFIVRLK